MNGDPLYTALVAGWLIEGIPDPGADSSSPRCIPHVRLTPAGLHMTPPEARAFAALVIEAARIAEGGALPDGATP